MQMPEIIAYIDQLGFWAWWIAAGLLIMLEALAPGAIFLWLGIAGVAVGGLVFLVPEMDWKVQLAVFAVLSVASIVISKRFIRNKPGETDHPDLNKRGKRLVGRELVLTEAIVDGRGRAKVGDSGWTVEGPDLVKGSRVRVIDISGATLIVESAD